MKISIITCVCGNDYPSRKDPDDELVKNRPQCGKCGRREYKKIKN